MAGRASIIGAAETNVGKVRNHNEDSHFIDPDAGIFIVCDGMGGHAAGEVASALAVQKLRELWSSESTQALARKWLANGTAEAHKQLMAALHGAVVSAHDAIIAEAERDRTKGGMGTTLIGAVVVGADAIFAQSGDSRAYLVRDGIAMQLTEDHTLLARLLAAGVDVDAEGDGARFKSMLTNALGIGQECKVSTFVVPLADGDRFLLCSDGVTEYVKEAEIGEVLCTQPSPARAAQKLVELALERGGGDNATALVVRVLEAGETARPAEQLRKDQAAIDAAPLWGKQLSPQKQLRALRIALPREHVAGERVPAQTLGDRVAWLLLEGEVEQDGVVRGPGTLLYPEALLPDRPLPDRDGLAVTRGELRALAIRADDFRELCEDDPELGEALLEALASEVATRSPARRTGKLAAQPEPAASPEPAAHPEPAPAPAPAPASEPTRLATDPSDGSDIARASTLPPEKGLPPVRDDSDPEIEIVAGADPEPPPAAPAEAPPAPDRVRAPTAPLKSRPSGPLILAKEERVAAAADLEDALTRLTLDDDWAELDDTGAPETAAPGAPADRAREDPEAPEVEVVEARPGDYSEPEIAILAHDDTESEAVPERLVDRKETVKVDDDGARVVEVVQDTSSQTLTVTVDEPPEPEVLIVAGEPPARSSPERPKSE